MVDFFVSTTLMGHRSLAVLINAGRSMVLSLAKTGSTHTIAHRMVSSFFILLLVIRYSYKHYFSTASILAFISSRPGHPEMALASLPSRS